MNYKKLIELYISNKRKSLEFEYLESGKKELEFINEHLNALYVAFKRNFSKTETESLKEALAEFNFKELEIPIPENKIEEAKYFLIDF